MAQSLHQLREAYLNEKSDEEDEEVQEFIKTLDEKTSKSSGSNLDLNSSTRGSSNSLSKLPFPVALPSKKSLPSKHHSKSSVHSKSSTKVSTKVSTKSTKDVKPKSSQSHQRPTSASASSKHAIDKKEEEEFIDPSEFILKDDQFNQSEQPEEDDYDDFIDGDLANFKLSMQKSNAFPPPSNDDLLQSSSENVQQPEHQPHSKNLNETVNKSHTPDTTRDLTNKKIKDTSKQEQDHKESHDLENKRSKSSTPTSHSKKSKENSSLKSRPSTSSPPSNDTLIEIKEIKVMESRHEKYKSKEKSIEKSHSSKESKKHHAKDVLENTDTTKKDNSEPMTEQEKKELNDIKEELKRNIKQQIKEEENDKNSIEKITTQENVEVKEEEESPKTIKKKSHSSEKRTSSTKSKSSKKGISKSKTTPSKDEAAAIIQKKWRSHALNKRIKKYEQYTIDESLSEQTTPLPLKIEIESPKSANKKTKAKENEKSIDKIKDSKVAPLEESVFEEKTGHPIQQPSKEPVKEKEEEPFIRNKKSLKKISYGTPRENTISLRKATVAVEPVEPLTESSPSNTQATPLEVDTSNRPTSAAKNRVSFASKDLTEPSRPSSAALSPKSILKTPLPVIPPPMISPKQDSNKKKPLTNKPVVRAKSAPPAPKPNIETPLVEVSTPIVISTPIKSEAILVQIEKEIEETETNPKPVKQDEPTPEIVKSIPTKPKPVMIDTCIQTDPIIKPIIKENHDSIKSILKESSFAESNVSTTTSRSESPVGYSIAYKKSNTKLHFDPGVYSHFKNIGTARDWHSKKNSSKKKFNTLQKKALELHAIHEDHSDKQLLSIETRSEYSDDESLRREAVISRSHESLSDLLKPLDAQSTMDKPIEAKKSLAFDISTQTPAFISRNDISINTDPPPSSTNEQSSTVEGGKKVIIIAPVTPDVQKKAHPITQKEPIKIKESKYLDKYLKQSGKKGTIKKKKPKTIPPPNKFPLLEPLKPRRHNRSRSTSRSGSASSQSSTASSSGYTSSESEKQNKREKRKSRKSDIKISKTEPFIPTPSVLNSNSSLYSNPNVYPIPPYGMNADMYSSPYSIQPTGNNWTNNPPLTSPYMISPHQVSPQQVSPQQHYLNYPQAAIDSNPSNYYYYSNPMMYPSAHSSYSSALDYNQPYSNLSPMSSNFYAPANYSYSHSNHSSTQRQSNLPRNVPLKKKTIVASKSSIPTERPWH